VHFLIFSPQLVPFVADVLSQPGGGRRSASPGVRSLHRQGSVLSTVSGAGVLPPLLASAAGETGTQQLTPQQLGVMGEC
jgi:hypothetical protein